MRLYCEQVWLLKYLIKQSQPYFRYGITSPKNIFPPTRTVSFDIWMNRHKSAQMIPPTILDKIEKSDLVYSDHSEDEESTDAFFYKKPFYKKLVLRWAKCYETFRTTSEIQN